MLLAERLLLVTVKLELPDMQYRHVIDRLLEFMMLMIIKRRE